MHTSKKLEKNVTDAHFALNSFFQVASIHCNDIEVLNDTEVLFLL